MNQTAWASPMSTSTEGFDGDENGKNKDYSDYGQGVPTGCSLSPLSQSTWRATFTRTCTSAVTAQFHSSLQAREPPVYDGLNDRISKSPDDPRRENTHSQQCFDEDALQKSYSGLMVSFPEDSMAQPDVIPGLDQQTPPVSSASVQEKVKSEVPYAQLIHKALKDAPDHSLTLNDLYKWFEDNTNKPNRTKDNGWQNSIRHNLSMNKAFRKAEPRTSSEPATLSIVDGRKVGTKKRVSRWSLCPEYINTVMPTTHFRNKNQNSSHKISSNYSTAPSGHRRRRNRPPHHQNSGSPGCTMPGRVISGRRRGRATQSAPSDNIGRQTSDANGYFSRHDYQYQLQTKPEYIDHPNDTGSVSYVPFADALTNSGGLDGNTGTSVAFMGTETSSLCQPYQFQQVSGADFTGVCSLSPASADTYVGGSDAQW
ncbi:fork head domain-containing protein [Colletotrichum incanum]|uniref:Fork head domain-containing protein n=1 Tax=Colletotrichum incanum TaxID=1573173 RepID=A0A161W0K3_COLIC|nr:fork head domain-containing protein [Colletotrichum incanum]